MTTSGTQRHTPVTLRSTEGPPMVDQSSHEQILLPSKAGEDISLVRLAVRVLQRRWWIGLLGLTLAMLAGLVTWAWPGSYTASVAFSPQAYAAGALSSLSGLSGLAAQFGVNVPSLSGGTSPDFYVDLLQTPTFLLPIVTSRFEFVDADGVQQNATYIDLLDIHGDSPRETMDLALTELANSLTISDKVNTGTVNVSVQTYSAPLSELIAKKLLDLVDDFNLGVRQQQAAALESFTNERLNQARGELNATEDSLARFLAQNRDFSRAPYLVLMHDRLQRAIGLKQGVYTTLVQTYEQARIDAARNTPSIVVVQPASIPLVPDRKHLLLKVLGSLVIGCLVATGWTVLEFFLGQARESEPAGMREMDRVRDEIRSELARIKQRLWFWNR